MKLIANIGNTNISWGFTESIGKISKINNSSTSTGKTTLKNAIKKILDFLEPDGIIIGGVVPEVVSALSAVSADFFDKKEITVLGYSEFEKLMDLDVQTKVLPGTDRLANAMTLNKFYDVPACVVDVGTAITVDVVDANGTFIGGSIGPGEKLQLNSLQENTAQLGKVKSLPKSVPAVGKSTAEAMAIGIRRAIPWGIMGILTGIEELFDGKIETIVVTGGGGLKLCLFLEKIYPTAFYDEICTIKGLAAAYWEMNKQ